MQVALRFTKTSILNIGYFSGGPPDGPAVFLLHGWPDSARSWDYQAAALQSKGFRTIVPYLRGSFPTQFLSDSSPRYAGAVAMAQDVIDLADALGIDSFSVAGHDWGARTAYTVAALFPQRVRRISALALAYQPGGAFQLASFAQSRLFWYQFFQCTPGGAEAVRKDPVGFARIQWETWSPEGWFREGDFSAASEHFGHADWAEITLNAYRSRYLAGEVIDHRYDALQQQLAATDSIDVPTLMIQGAADSCDPPALSEDQAHYFRKGYQRIVLDGVGHFPHREAAQPVTQAILLHEKA